MLSFSIPSLPAVLYNAKMELAAVLKETVFFFLFSVSFISFGLLIPS